MEHSAFHDSLTELHNGNYLRVHLAGARAALEDSGDQLALVRLDLAELRNVNKTLGDEAGDDLLRRSPTGCARSTTRSWCSPGSEPTTSWSALPSRPARARAGRPRLRLSG